MWHMLRRLRARWQYRTFDRDLKDELEFHRTEKVRELEAAGVDAQEAELRARRALGNEVRAREEGRAVWVPGWWERLGQDVRYALRSSVRQPTFTLTAVGTLVLGITATTLVFSVVSAALLTPPPYPDPGRILTLTAFGRSVDGELFHYVQDRVRTFEAVGAHGAGTGWNVVAGDHAQYAEGLPVSHGVFRVLGVQPLVGRAFTASEDSPGGPRVAILSDALSRRLFESPEAGVGQIVRLGGVAHEVVGVMPAGFRTIPSAEVWTPLQVSPRDNSWNYVVLGRVGPEVQEAEAAAELDALRHAMARDLPRLSTGHRSSLRWISYQEALGMASRNVLLLVLAGSGVLLLIACVNVAGLQLVRALSRRREMATRTALGGGRARLVQQVLTESVVLALAAGIIAVALTYAGSRLMVDVLPPGLVLVDAVTVDLRVLVVALALALGTGVLFGLAPMGELRRLAVASALRAGGRQTTGRPTARLRSAFTVAPLALALVLLAASGLLVRTLVNMRGAELGFDANHVVVGKMSLQGAPDQAGAQFGTFVDGVLARVRNLPGVSAAAIGNNIPVEHGLNLSVEPPPDALVNDMRAVDWRYITADYLRVFRIPLRAGRGFDERDGAAGTAVALVNEAFARMYFGEAPAVGRYLRVAEGFGDRPRLIVGVVADVKGRSGSGWTAGPNALGAPTAPTMYVPAAQVPPQILELVHHFFPVSWVVRTSAAAPDVRRGVERVVGEAAPGLPFIRFQTMHEVVAEDLAVQRFLAVLLGVFAVVAVGLATIGVYGVAAYTATERRQEVGIRMALGAKPAQVFRERLGEALRLSALAIALGTFAAMAVSRALESYLFGVRPVDAATFLGVSAVLLLMTLAASAVPALNAARMDPTVALRTE